MECSSKLSDREIHCFLNSEYSVVTEISFPNNKNISLNGRVSLNNNNVTKHNILRHNVIHINYYT